MKEILLVAGEAASNNVLWIGDKVPIATDYAIDKELHLTHDDRFEGLPCVTVRIEKHLSVQEDKQSQTLLVKVISTTASSGEGTSYLTTGNLPDRVTAKVWDEGHYSYPQHVEGERLPMTLEEHSFIEAHAYAQLKPLQGTYIPKFYGYYFLYPEGRIKGRRVHIVLMEYVEGTSPLALQIYGSENMGDLKKEIADETLRCLNEIHSLGVFHFGVQFENFLLSFDGDGVTLKRTCLIDFQRVRFRWEKLPNILAWKARDFDLQCLEDDLQEGRFMERKFPKGKRAFPKRAIKIPATYE